VTLRWGGQQRDRLLAVLAAAFAATLVAAARGIEDSLLADAVGAGGVPQGVGMAMFVAAVALFAKSFSGGLPGTASARADKPRAVLRTTGLVLILIAYGLLLPWLGYPLTISLLVGAVGWLAGAAPRLPLLLCAAVSGPALWAMFDRALQVRMPGGTLWG
jgi:putative tricarboxylic transport membrane protein